MISGVLIEAYGVINTMRAFAITGTVVLAVLVFSQYAASLLEQRDNHRAEYQMVSDSEDSKSEVASEGGDTVSEMKE